MARFSAFFSGLAARRAAVLRSVGGPPSSRRLPRASLAARDASSTASRSRWARSRASLRSVARVERLSAIGWSSGRQSATASGPSTSTAAATARSAPTRSPQRGQQLGDVHPQHQVAGRDLAAAQIGQDHPCRNGPPAARRRPAAGARSAATGAPRTCCQALAQQRRR